MSAGPGVRLPGKESDSAWLCSSGALFNFWDPISSFHSIK